MVKSLVMPGDAKHGSWQLECYLESFVISQVIDKTVGLPGYRECLEHIYSLCQV